MRVLVTGGTGYIGGRLVPRLLRQGHSVRVLVRDPRGVEGRAWADRVEVVTGNLLDPDSEIRYILENKRVVILKNELNTRPQFFYFFG